MITSVLGIAVLVNVNYGSVSNQITTYTNLEASHLAIRNRVMLGIRFIWIRGWVSNNGGRILGLKQLEENHNRLSTYPSS